jgi:eukaryotic-like serine/threonine-protein kinase
VREADWSPDGENIAVIRDVGGRDRLEFPIGKVLYEASGYLSEPRVSPSGDRVAFLEHPFKFDDRGGVAVVDLAGRKSTLADGYFALEGLAWSQANEILFSGGVTYSQFTIYGVGLTGRVREIVQSAGGVTIHDVALDGRWLVTRDDIRTDLLARPAGAREEVSLSWLDQTYSTKLSPDGRTLLFQEDSGRDSIVAIRKTDGSPVVRLGDGQASDLSPDGKWVLAFIPRSRQPLVIYPTGAGESRRLDSGPVETYSSARWFPDGRRVLACGSEPNRATRCYVQDISGGAPHPVTRENTGNGIVSPDGRQIIVRESATNIGSTGKSALLYSLDTGSSRVLQGIDETDSVVRWERDGRSLVLSHGLLPTRLERFSLENGRRDLIRVITPSNPVGADRIARTTVADDPNVYAYTLYQQRSRLFILEGAK